MAVYFVDYGSKTVIYNRYPMKSTDENYNLSGKITLTLKNEEVLLQFCRKYIPACKDNWKPIAIRVFSGAETIVTVYLHEAGPGQSAPGESLPVKKFKLENIPLSELWNYVQEFNFTLNSEDFNIDQMVVED